MVLQNVDHNTKGGKNLKIKVAGVKSNPTICAENPALSFVNISTTINECEKMKIFHIACPKYLVSEFKIVEGSGSQSN